MQALGHVCLTAEDGDTAWRLFHECLPEVVITDRVMPGVDGLELCRRVRADTTVDYTYIVLATSLGDRQDVLSGMEAGSRRLPHQSPSTRST